MYVCGGCWVHSFVHVHSSRFSLLKVKCLYTHGRVTETGRPFTKNAALVVCVEVKVTVDRETFWKATIAV